MSINEIAEHPSPMSAATSSAGKLPRRRFFSDMPDKGLFALIALLGFGAIFAFKIWGYDHDYIAAFAVLLMVLYGVVAYHIPLVAMRLDRLGDNFYYLGFIYTLASLSAALFQLQSGMQIQALLGSFGIALITTIVGIAGRVLFVQLRSDLDDVEERSRRDLAAASSDLRAQLSLSVREFETFRTGLLQTLTEVETESSKSTKRQIKAIESLARASAERIEAAFESNRKQSQQLMDALGNITKSVESAAARLESMELPSERLNAQLASFATELEASLKRLGTTIEDVARRSTRRRRWRALAHSILRRWHAPKRTR